MLPTVSGIRQGPLEHIHSFCLKQSGIAVNVLAQPIADADVGHYVRFLKGLLKIVVLRKNRVGWVL